MTTITQILDVESLSRLARLRGTTWRYFGGAQVSTWLTDVSIFVSTDDGDVTMSGETTDLDFEGEADNYSRFRIDDGATDLDTASRAGHLYHFNGGHRLEDVLIVREIVTERRDGKQAWTYVNDLAVVFVLDNGVIAISKVSHHTELLSVVRADQLDALDLDEPSHGWEDKLDVEFSFTREVLSINDLISA